MATASRSWRSLVGSTTETSGGPSMGVISPAAPDTASGTVRRPLPGQARGGDPALEDGERVAVPRGDRARPVARVAVAAGGAPQMVVDVEHPGEQLLDGPGPLRLGGIWREQRPVDDILGRVDQIELEPSAHRRDRPGGVRDHAIGG